MERPTSGMLRVGDWCVNPSAGQISRNGENTRVEERTMRLLLCLAEHAGQVVSIDDLLNRVWADVSVSPDSVYQAVASLRRLLRDDPKQPTYVVTLPRLGYRMVAQVSPWAVSPEGQDGRPSPQPVVRVAWIVASALSLALIAVVAYKFYARAAHKNASAASVSVSQTSNSIVVLPFLDLTEGMKEEEFADGMTEELIDRLSKIPALRVQSPTSSFYYKGKQTPIAEIARALGVAYVLDGSVRKSAGRLRIAARLVRAENGYVIWSESYDRPLQDVLMVQDDIAEEVTKALRASIEFPPSR